MEVTKVQCVTGKKWQGASSACQMNYKFQTGPLGTAGYTWNCCTWITVLLKRVISQERGVLEQLLFQEQLEPPDLPLLFIWIKSTTPQWLPNCAILWEASVSVGLCSGRAGWVGAVKLRSHKAELMCYSAANPGARLRQSPAVIPGAVWR